MRRVSSKQRERLKKYEQAKAEFFEEFEEKVQNGSCHHWCPVADYLWNEKLARTDIHHMSGRSGDSLYDKQTFLFISRKAHSWIHDNPKQAEEHGWLDPRRNLARL